MHIYIDMSEEVKNALFVNKETILCRVVWRQYYNIEMMRLLKNHYIFASSVELEILAKLLNTIQFA